MMHNRELCPHGPFALGTRWASNNVQCDHPKWFNRPVNDRTYGLVQYLLECMIYKKKDIGIFSNGWNDSLTQASRRRTWVEQSPTDSPFRSFEQRIAAPRFEVNLPRFPYWQYHPSHDFGDFFSDTAVDLCLLSITVCVTEINRCPIFCILV